MIAFCPRIQNSPRTVDATETYWQLLAAFSMWSEASSLTFHELADDAQSADIDITFAAGYHNDGSPFDGQGNSDNNNDKIIIVINQFHFT